MIREFDLDAPMLGNPERRKFRVETRCVSALFARCYKPSKSTGKPRKILAEVVNGIEREQVVDLLGVLVVQVRGDVHQYLEADDKTKQESALVLLMDGVMRVAAQREWNATSFQDAASEVRRRNFVNEWVWGSALSKPRGGIGAEILIQHQVSEAIISVRFVNATGEEVKRVRLISAEPHEFAFYEYLGKFSWVGNEGVELLSRSGNHRLSAYL